MAIKRTTSIKQIMQHMEDEITSYENVLIRRLAYMGEKCVKQAREFGSYKDQTGNLRSSIGYAIVKDGQVVLGGGFTRTKKGSGGVKEGQKVAEDIISQFPRGIVLIVVAGMNYAAYVEAKGYDVLTSSEMLAEREVPKMLEKLNLYQK